MNWQQLIYFEKAAKYEHLTKSAEELFITSSALSRAMNNLEEELGIKLFEKDGRNIRLNQYGRIFYSYVQAAIQQIDAGTAMIQNMAGVYTGTVRVSSIFSVGAGYIPRLLAGFHAQHEQVKVEITQKTTQQILHDVMADITDIGFCGELDDTEKLKPIRKDWLYDEKMFLIVPNRHRLAAQKAVCFDEIKDETFIGYHSSTGIVHTIDKELARHAPPGFKLKTRFQSNEDSNVVGLVKENLGVAFVVDVPSIWTGAVTVLELKDLFFRRQIFMVCKEAAYFSPAVNLFRTFALLNNKSYT